MYDDEVALTFGSLMPFVDECLEKPYQGTKIGFVVDEEEPVIVLP